MVSFYDFQCLPSDYVSFNETRYILKTGHTWKTPSYSIFETICVMVIVIWYTYQRKLHCKKLQTFTIVRFVLFSSVVISAILLPILLLLFFIFTVYRQVIALILKVKLKEKYGGFFKGSDTVWAIEDVSKSIINVVLIVRWDENCDKLYAVVRNSVEQKLFQHSERLPKLLSTYHKTFGYYYLKKNELVLDDCVAFLQSYSEKESIEKDELLKLLSKISNDPLPYNHTAFWQVLVGRQPVKWINKIENNIFYPIVFRIHHSLGDGSSLLKMLMGIFADNLEVKQDHLNTNKVFSRENRLNLLLNYVSEQFTCLLKKFSIYKKIIPIILSAPSQIILQMLRVPDQNSVHGPHLSGEKILACLLEDSSGYIEIVKSIKQKVPGVKFSDVLLTLISRSFKQYFKMNLQEVPNTLTAVIPVYPDISDYSKISQVETLYLDNKFSVAMLTLPLKSNEFGVARKSRIIELLEMVKNETNALRKSHYYEINYWLLNIVATLLPEPLLRPLLHSAQSTLIVSNVPGPPSITMFGGIQLKDILFWVPHRGSTGIGISILSYDGRLQMGINVDKNLISKETDAQSILDGLFNSLIEMDYETRAIVEDIV